MKSTNASKVAIGLALFAVVFSLLGGQAFAAYCSASGGCYEYIKSVQVGDIDNTGTGCGYYVDYTHLSTAMDIGQDYNITVINSDLYYLYDWCGIWVDWDQDGDFDDANEAITVSGDYHTFTGTITPPGSALSGNTRMRVRIRWTGGGGAVEPCGDTPYGEVEDYTIIILPSGPQTRVYGKKWHDLNDNGEMDGGEPGLSGWTIFLDEDRDGEIDPNDVVTTTDIQGNYELTGMEPNEYYSVSELDQDGWINTYPGAGGIHYRIRVEENNDVEVNFGNYQLHNGDVNGFKFHDVNNNGVWDDGEEPLSDWEIYIDENQNGQWDSGEPKTTTSATGYYEFTNLEPGYYNIMEVPQAGWFQTFPGITSGRLWGADSSADNVTYFIELDPVTMTVKNRLVAPFYSFITGHCVVAAGPSTLFYCPFRITGFETVDSLFFEIDPDTGLVVDQGVLDIPSNEFVWTCAWHRGILYVTSTDDIQGNPPVFYLNRFDAFTKELISRVLLPEGFGDDMTTDPYRDVLLINIAIPWSVYEINPDTAALVKTIQQQLPPRVNVAYTRGVLYRSFWGQGEMQINHREDGSQISLIDYDENLRLDGMGGGIGVRGGHRVWVGKRDVTANFGNRLDSEGSFSGTKYEDLNGNGVRDANEPGMADWAIYVDLDGDTHLDASEPATLTDANGNWVIEGLEYGRYFVREVQQKGYVRTEPGLGWTDTIDINGPRDIVFDDMRNLLYMSTEAGEIERFDLSTNQFLSPITVGGSPHGMDITADYGALYVADTQLSDGNGVVHKVNAETLNVTDLTYSVGQFEDGSYDIAIGSEGIALFTASYSGSGWVPLYVLDTSTDIITVRPDVLGQSTINDDVRLVRSYDRSTIWLINNSSNGWIGVYDAPTDTFTAEKEFNNYLNQSPIALNRDGSMAAIQLYRHCRIVDSDFNMVMGLDDSKMGAEFDPSSDVFYQFQQRWHVLFALDTVVWELLDYISPGGVTETYERFTRGETAMTADGRVLGITEPNYVALHRKEHYSLALPGRRISGLDFGNKTVLCGDIDGDRDVDFLDLGCMSEEWLCSELSMDVAPTVRDYVVSMPDFARFANAWQSLDGDSNWDVLCDVAPAGGDGAVDNKDLKVLTEEWLLEGMICLSDIAGANGPDGHVDLQDFACLAGNWQVAENIIEYDEDFETGDFSNLPWEHGGASPWTIDSFIYFEGNYSARSADLPWYDESILSVTATCGEGDIYFMLKSGSGGTFRFFVDGFLVFDWDPWDEDLDWALVMIPVTAGIHTLEWSYEHDGHGEDRAWIDAIRFPPAND
ncbi:MAG: SdrD B-like domain-containing protein [Planctomycetota bacterium]|jgi:DNA-binding beta-propeller fold protein YncE